MGRDRIDWVSLKPREAIAHYLRWREAVERADQGDLEALIDLFQSEEVLGPEARDLVADLLKHHDLKKKKGGQATPAYRMTPAEGRVHHQAAGVRYWKNKGLSNEAAIRAALRDDKREKFEEEHYLDKKPPPTPTDQQLDELVTDAEFQLLENFIAGRRGSSRRIKQRRRS